MMYECPKCKQCVISYSQKRMADIEHPISCKECNTSISRHYWPFYIVLPIQAGLISFLFGTLILSINPEYQSHLGFVYTVSGGLILLIIGVLFLYYHLSPLIVYHEGKKKKSISLYLVLLAIFAIYFIYDAIFTI